MMNKAEFGKALNYRFGVQLFQSKSAQRCHAAEQIYG